MPSPHSPARNKTRTSPKGVLSSVTQRTPRLRAMATITKAKGRVKGVGKLIITKQTPRAVDVDVQRDFADTLDLYTLLRVGQNAMEV